MSDTQTFTGGGGRQLSSIQHDAIEVMHQVWDQKYTAQNGIT